MASQEDKRHVARLIKTHTARLQVLELKKAQQGTSADPVIDTEIDELRAVIAELQPHQPSDKTLEARAAVAKLYENNVEFLIAQLGGLQNRQIKTEEQVRAIAVTQHEDQLERLDLRVTIQSLVTDVQDNQQKAERGRRRNFYLQVAALMLLGFLALSLWLILWR